MKSVYYAVRTGSLNKTVLKGLNNQSMCISYSSTVSSILLTLMSDAAHRSAVITTTPVTSVRA